MAQSPLKLRRPSIERGDIDRNSDLLCPLSDASDLPIGILLTRFSDCHVSNTEQSLPQSQERIFQFPLLLEKLYMRLEESGVFAGIVLVAFDLDSVDKRLQVAYICMLP